MFRETWRMHARTHAAGQEEVGGGNERASE